MGFLRIGQEPRDPEENLVPDAAGSADAAKHHSWMFFFGALFVSCAVSIIVATVTACVLFRPRRGPISETLKEVKLRRQTLLDDLDRLKQQELSLGDGVSVEDDPSKAITELPTSAAENSAAYDIVFRRAAKHVANKVGPQFEKPNEVKAALEGRAGELASRAKTFCMNELNSTCAAVHKALDTEEAKLVSHWNDAVDSYLPQVSALFGGLLAPTMLSFNLWSSLIQVVFFLFPVVFLCAWAVMTDFFSSCPGIPSLHVCILAQLALGMAVLVSRSMMVARIWGALRALRTESDEMREMLLRIESHDPALLREIFIGHSVAMQRALIVEEEIRTSRLWHVIGSCTALWLVCAFWLSVLLLGWTFVPGTVAFHPSESELPNFCGAWASVLAARFNMVLWLLWLWVNTGVVVAWMCKLIMQLELVQEAAMRLCKSVDDERLLGLPALQCVAKSIVFRDLAGISSARLTVASHDEQLLETKQKQLEARLQDLRQRLDATKSAKETLYQEAADERAGLEEPLENIEDTVNKDSKLWKERGAEVIRKAEEQVQTVEKAVTHDFERVVMRIATLAEKFAKSEALQAMIERVEQAGHHVGDAAGEQVEGMVQQVGAADKVKAVSAQAKEAAQKVAGKVVESTEGTAEKAQEVSAQLGQEAAEQVQESKRLLGDQAGVVRARQEEEKTREAAGEAQGSDAGASAKGEDPA